MEEQDSIQSQRPSSPASSRSSTDESSTAGMASDNTPGLSRKPQKMPFGFEPRPIDVVCGRGRRSTKHNEPYMDQIRANSAQYKQSNAVQKTAIIANILAICRSQGTHFVRKIDNTDEYEDIGDKAARRKISHAIRDFLTQKGKSVRGGCKPSSLGSNSDTDSKKRPSSQNSNGSDMKRRRNEDNAIDATSDLSIDLLDASANSRSGDETPVNIDSKGLPMKPREELFPSEEMLTGLCNEKEYWGKETTVNDPTIAVQNGILSMHGGEMGIDAVTMAPHSANMSLFPGLNDPRRGVNPDFPASTVAAYPGPSTFQQQLMQQYTMPQSMTCNNSLNTLHSNNFAFLPMMRSGQTGTIHTNLSFNTTNKSAWQLGTSIELHQQQQTQQSIQHSMSVMHTNAANSTSYFHPMAIGACMSDPSSYVGGMQQFLPVATHTTTGENSMFRPVAINSHTAMRSEIYDTDDIGFPFSQPFGQDIDVELDQGDFKNDDDEDDGRSADVDDDDDLIPYPFPNDDEPEPL
jgi:hypothetical protein